MIAISPSCCPGDPGCSASAPSNAGLKSQTPGGNVATEEKVAESVSSPSKAAKHVVNDSDPCPEL